MFLLLSVVRLSVHIPGPLSSRASSPKTLFHPWSTKAGRRRLRHRGFVHLWLPSVQNELARSVLGGQGLFPTCDQLVCVDWSIAGPRGNLTLISIQPQLGSVYSDRPGLRLSVRVGLPSGWPRHIRGTVDSIYGTLFGRGLGVRRGGGDKNNEDRSLSRLKTIGECRPVGAFHSIPADQPIH